MDKKKLYEDLLSQLSTQNKGYAPDYDRFSSQSMEVCFVSPSYIINTSLCSQDNSNKVINASDSMLSLEEATSKLEALDKNPKEILSFELPTSDAVVMDVYKQFTCKDEYRSLFLTLSTNFGVFAHITLGLIDDAMFDEMETIDFLAANPPKGIIFSIYTPPVCADKPQKLMPIERAAAVFMYAHKKLPNCSMTLSKKHPDGNYGKELEILAFMHGVKNREN